mgnify:CR=1 FL=1
MLTGAIDAGKCDMFLQRDDLIFTGRTLFGSMPPKGQELDDHYRYLSLKTSCHAYRSH